MDKKYIVAFEISGSQIKGALASMAPGPEAVPTIEAIASDDQINCVRYGRVQNLADASKHVSGILSRLQKSPALAGRSIISAYVGLAGRSLTSERVSVAIDLPTEMEITPEIINKLYRNASGSISAQKLALKVMPRKFMVDNQMISNPVGVLGRKLQGDFTIVTCNPVNRRYIDMVFNDRLQLPIAGEVVTPLATADMTLSEEEKQLGCVMVDMGAQTTTVAVYKDRALQYIATLPIGSHNITRDLSIGLNITEEKAENAKCTQGDALSETHAEDSPGINNYVQSRANEIIANIKAQIEYAGYQCTDMASGFVLTGRGIRLKNFDRLLENNTKMKVRKATLPANMDFHTDSTIIPADFISLVSILYKECRDSDSQSCVKEPAPAARPVSTYNAPQTKPQPVQKPDETRVQPPAPKPEKRPTPPVQTYYDDDDANWDKDEPVGGRALEIPDPKKEHKKKAEAKPAKPAKPAKEEKPARSKPSFIDNIKNKINTLLSTQDIDENDTQI